MLRCPRLSSARQRGVEDPPLEVLQVGSVRQGLRGLDAALVAEHGAREGLYASGNYVPALR